jgi:FtsZ-interacting cell division protein ZipA
MPQLRWTLLLLGVLFVILLWWLERRSQRAKFRDRGIIEKEIIIEPQGTAPVFREPNLTLPEMRAREPSAPQELPVVEIEDDSLNARRVETGQPLMDPPTLSLPVLESGPTRRSNNERVEPSVSGTQWITPAKDFDVPRLDTPAPKSPVNRIDLADTSDSGSRVNDEQAFNDEVFGGGNPNLDLSEESTSPDVGAELRASRSAAVPESLRRDPRASAAEWNLGAPAARVPPEMTGAPPEVTRIPASPAAPQPTVSEARPVQERVPSAISDPDSGRPTPDAEAAQEEAAPESEEPPVPRFTAADVTPIAEPIVDWPPDDQRRVVALRLVAPPPDRLPGRALRLALASEGFILGKFQIFHKPDSDGRAVLSAANLSKPGTFDLGTMDVQRFGGLSLFVVLPGPKPPLKAFEELLATARNLNERLQGALQDERGGPLTPTRITTLRDSLSSTEAAS